MNGSVRDPALEALRAAWSRRRGLAAIVFAACAAAAIAASIALPSLYRATATVVVERDQVSDAIVRPAAPGAFGTRFQTITERVLGRDRLGELVRRFGLYRSATTPVPIEALVDRMRRDIGIDLKGADAGLDRGDTVAFTVSFRADDAAKAAAVANALATLYVSENSERRERQASGTTAFLANQLRDLEAQLAQRQRRIDAFKARYMGELPEQVGANLATLERLNADLQQNRERQQRAADRRESAARHGSVPGAIPGAESPSERLLRLEKELASLRARYRDDHPDVVALKTQIESAEKDAAAADARTGSSPDPARLTLEAEERRTRAEIDAYQRRVEAAPRHEEELRQLERDYDGVKESYDALRKREDEARLADRLEEGRMGEQFRILDAAVVPRVPIAPNRFELLLAGFLAAAGAAVVAVAARERTDSSFHTVDALRTFTTIPVLAAIPRIVTARDRRRAAWRLAALAGAAGALVVVVGFAAWKLADGNDALVALLARGPR